MLHEFLHANRESLIERCRRKVALRPAPRPTREEMEYGIPLFLAQLIETLRLEQITGALADDGPTPQHSQARDGRFTDIATTAAKHGHELLQQGFTVNQVVHDYGDLCQAVTELATETGAVISTEEFHTLNRCLDEAIADAVTEFARQRDQMISEKDGRAMIERLGFLAHELRNLLTTAMLSFALIKRGGVAIDGATAGVLDRSLVGLQDLIDRTLADVRLAAGPRLQLDLIAVDRFIAEVQVAASIDATSRQCEFTVHPVEPGLEVRADRQLLYSAVSNLLQNAFKFTRSRSRVTLRAYGRDDRVLIEVEDRCGGLPPGKADALFNPFEQHGADRSGLGLGLSISRRAVEASDGTLAVRDMPGIGCVFSIDLPRRRDTQDSTGHSS